MKANSIMFFLAAFLLALPLLSCTSENSIPEKTLSLFFPDAQDFVLKNPTLPTDKISSIESALGQNSSLEISRQPSTLQQTPTRSR